MKEKHESYTFKINEICSLELVKVIFMQFNLENTSYHAQNIIEDISQLGCKYSRKYLN